MNVKSFLLPLLITATAVASEHSAPQAGAQSLDVFHDGGRLHRLTGELESSSTPGKLFHARSEDGGATWSAPVRVDAGLRAPYGLRRGMDAQIAGMGDHLVAVWTSAGSDKWGSGPLVTALSADGGKTWTGGGNPADDGSTDGHGFVDIGADDKGAFHATWLDGRDGRQGLRYARSLDRGKSWSPNVTLQPGTCECCANVLITAPGGTVAILFREHDPRDMAIARSADGGQTWAKPARVGAFNWKFQGCPHVGGALAFAPDDPSKLHSLVWTAEGNHVGIHYLRSGPDGAWSAPVVRLGDGTASHPDLAAGPAGKILATWDQSEGANSSIWAAVSSDGGASWQPARRISAESANAAQPRVAHTKHGFRVLWTERTTGKPATVASALLP